MSEPSESYLRVQYELRPSKQVERRMIIDGLRKLSLMGFEVEDYKYIGFGSIYFVDFILFHKFLSIDKMLSVEKSIHIKDRVHFNKAFDCIEIQMKPVNEVIPSLSADLKYILWLDYDENLSREMVEDIRMAATYLSVGSVLLITVDVEPPGGDKAGPKEWKEYFEEHAAKYLGLLEIEEFGKSNLPRINVEIITRVIKDGLTGRIVEFIPIFNFEYADGHRMITVGGIIGTSTEKRRISGSKLNQTVYYRRNLKKEEPYYIRVPRVTRKERLFLDSAMPCDDNWTPGTFEMSEKDVQAYREIYRFFPAYAELLL